MEQSKLGGIVDDSRPTLHVDYDGRHVLVKLPYQHADSKERLIQIHKAYWKPEVGCWSIPTSRIYGIKDTLVGLPFKIRYTPRFLEMYKVTVEGQENPKALAIKALEDVPWSNPGFKRILMPHQRVGVAFLHAADGVALVADSPGLGKTTTVLAFLEDVKGRTLVICPANAKYVWLEEVAACTTNRTVRVISGRKVRPESEYRDTDFLVINFDVLVNHMEAILAAGFDNLVVDESHYIKDITRQRTKAVLKFARRARRRMELSGTPYVTKAVDLFTQFQLLRPDEYADYQFFRERYGNPQQQRRIVNMRTLADGRRQPVYDYVTVYEGASNMNELRRRMSGFVLRRHRDEVKNSLPEKTYKTIHVELSAETIKEYNERQNDYGLYLRRKGRVDEAARAEKALSLTTIGSLRQLVSDAKLDSAIELIDSIIDDGAMDETPRKRKVLVFTIFKNSLERLKKHYGDRCLALSGATTEKERKELQTRFNTDDSIQVFVGNVRSASEAITLTAADSVIFYDIPRTPKDFDQCESRAHRTGQKWPVTVYKLVAEGVKIDQQVLNAVSKREATGKTILGDTGADEESVAGAIEAEVLEAFISDLSP